MHAVGEVVCGLHDAHIALSVTSLTSENVPGPLPLNRTESDGKLGEGLGTRLYLPCLVSWNYRSCDSYIHFSALTFKTV